MTTLVARDFLISQLCIRCKESRAALKKTR